MKYLIAVLAIISALSINAQVDTTEFTSSLWANSTGRITLIPDSVSYDTIEVAAFIYVRKYTKLVQTWVEDTTNKYSIGFVKTEEVPTFVYTQEILHKVTKTTHRNNACLLWVISGDVSFNPIEVTYYNYKWEVVPTKSIFTKVDIDE